MITEWPTQRNVTNVKYFMGSTRYYWMFIKGFSQIAHPINSLYRKGVKFVYFEKCESSFQWLKRFLTSMHVLKIIDLEKDFIICIDACINHANFLWSNMTVFSFNIFYWFLACHSLMLIHKCINKLNLKMKTHWIIYFKCTIETRKANTLNGTSIFGKCPWKKLEGKTNTKNIYLLWIYNNHFQQ